MEQLHFEATPQRSVINIIESARKYLEHLKPKELFEVILLAFYV